MDRSFLEAIILSLNLFKYHKENVCIKKNQEGTRLRDASFRYLIEGWFCLLGWPQKYQNKIELYEV